MAAARAGVAKVLDAHKQSLERVRRGEATASECARARPQQQASRERLPV